MANPLTWEAWQTH